jgi:hypothetical protein
MQIQLAVEKGAPRELARFGQPRATGEQRADDLARDDRRAVDLQFQNCLPGIAVRRRERDR